MDWDARTRTKGIYYIPGSGRNGWSKFVADELGNYDYLLGCDVSCKPKDRTKGLTKKNRSTIVNRMSDKTWSDGELGSLR